MLLCRVSSPVLAEKRTELRPAAAFHVAAATTKPAIRGAVILEAVASHNKVKHVGVQHPFEGRAVDKMDHDAVTRMRKAKVQKYVEGWKSDVDMSNRMNVMNGLLLIALGSPLLGLVFAYATYGTLWGVSPFYGGPGM